MLLLNYIRYFIHWNFRLGWVQVNRVCSKHLLILLCYWLTKMSNGSEKTAIAYAMIVIQKILPSSNSIHHRMSKLSIKPTTITTKEKAHSIFIANIQNVHQFGIGIITTKKNIFHVDSSWCWKNLIS